MLGHVEDILHHYGESTGVKIARKHVGWYSKGLHESAEFRVAVNQSETAVALKSLIQTYYGTLLSQESI